MKNVKKFLSVVMICSVVISCIVALSACKDSAQEGALTSTVADVAELTVTEAPSSVSEIGAATEPATEQNTEPERVANKMEPLTTSEYVYNAREEYYNFNNYFHITDETGYDGDMAINRLPQLNIDSDDAREINEYLLETHSEFFEREHEYSRLDYVVYQHGDVLTLVLEEQIEGHHYFYLEVYNIDVTTGELLDTEDVVNMCGLELDEAYDFIRDYAKDLYDEWEVEMPDMAIEYADELAEVREKTSSDENMKKTQFYFDAEGRLISVFTRYWFIAGGLHTTIVPMDVYKQ